ncbi:hypothetical protein O181_001102 [Austropuccinia psidii MF-1]|uniref:Uncharacterized protein n=1 Tax=Austropuccinia psidii MF-1 TaxID=1389203 RepID=A0A9Q3BA60_9BASI|nr:hypothetical protein [Austropuccinia psidii MF-1]
MVITKGWTPRRQLKLLEERAASITENQATIQAIKEQPNQKEHTLIPSGSQEVNQQDSPVASHHSGTSRSVTKSNHSAQCKVLSRRRQESKGEKRLLSARGKESQTPLSRSFCNW